VTLRKKLLVGIAALAAGIQFFGPRAGNPAADPGQSFFRQVALPPDLAATLRRACRDCHSNDSVWPWYTHVAPVSWWTVDHVNNGRSHLNFSEWGRLKPEEAAFMLENICRQVQARRMPLPSYLWMHRSAALSEGDVAALCQWTAAQRRAPSSP
jgi:hypothetical protein